MKNKGYERERERERERKREKEREREREKERKRICEVNLYFRCATDALKNLRKPKLIKSVTFYATSQ